MNSPRSVLFGFLLIFLTTFSIRSQDGQSSITGQVKDQQGRLVVGAHAILFDRLGETRVEITDENGTFRFQLLPAGTFALHVKKTGFAVYESPKFDIGKNTSKIFEIVLDIPTRIETVEVPLDQNKPEADPNSNKSSMILKGDDLESLPDDPEALESALKILAGTGAGPDGGEIFIDGFSSRNIPPKTSIQEIRINRNPFSAEFDRVGYGRIEIITKVGKTDLGGSVFYRFTNDRLNARNPFALIRSPFRSHRYGGDVSGSFLKKRASFFIDTDRRSVTDSAVINASIVDNQFAIVPFRQTAKVPESAMFFNARTDFQVNQLNTLTVRYGLTAKSNENVGVGNFSLPDQAFKTRNSNQTFQVAQTSVVSQTVINELRFQYERLNRRNIVDETIPTINVSESFVGGGPSVGATKFTENRLEITENVTYAPDQHTVRFGMRGRWVSLNDISQPNFNGTYIFTGGLAPELENGEIVVDATGQPILENVTSIERYRRTLFFRQQGLSPVAIRERGGGASQFSINGGSEETGIHQLKASGYAQGDWRITGNFGLSLGLRFETQTNIKRKFDLAPRAAFVWSPRSGGEKKLATVVRGGFGIFYIRFGEGLVLDAAKFDGNRIERYIVTETTVLDSFVEPPTVSDLAGIGQPLTIRQVAKNLRAPYISHSAFSVEQQLPFNTVITATYSDLRVRRAFRSRNVNAPIVGSLSRPVSDMGDIYQYESSGRFDSRRLSLTLSTRFWKFSNLYLKYDLSSARSDTEGPMSFPVNQYDLSNEYGRSALDARHNLIMSASISAPLGIRLSPLIVAVSGRPFNITTGDDSNKDSIFNERPAFAADLTRASVVRTSFGDFDLSPTTGSKIIPRNFGESTPFFAVSLRASKSFRFNLSSRKTDGQGKKSAAKRFGLNLSVQVWNLLNRSNLNLPVGSLSSPFFGRATSIAGSFGGGDPLSGSRTIEGQARFSF